MQPTLSGDAEAARLRAGVQPAIAASANDATVAVELELVSILDGPAFHGSARSRAFLRFVVEEALAGRQDLLKERIVGSAVLGKPSDYDTGADSTVRVRANEVRKRLASHYDHAEPKAGIRIELPLGTYAPKFTTVAVQVVPQPEQTPHPPPMLFWQLAAPTLIALFMTLVVVRGGVESSDAFSRFWDQAMADAAMPIERLADMLHVPVHIVAAGGVENRGAYVVRLSLTEKPIGQRPLRLAGATMFRGTPREHAVWLWAENADALRSAAQTLTSRSGFPEID
jgi:hypothetical protein